MSDLNVLYLLKHCNLDCTYCYEKSTRTVEKMNKETAQQHIDFILSHMPTNEQASILLFGGEPMLNWDVFIFCIQYIYDNYFLKGRNVHVSTVTNATLLKPERVRQLFKYNKLFSIHISIDGDRETTNVNRKFKSGVGAYDIIAKNIPHILMYFPLSIARMVVTQDSINKFYDNVVHLNKVFGFRHFCFQSEHGIIHDPEYLELWNSQMQKIQEFLSSIPGGRINEVQPPRTHEEYHKHAEEAKKSDRLYRYYLPDKDVVVQKIYVEADFQHFNKGANADYNLSKGGQS